MESEPVLLREKGQSSFTKKKWIFFIQFSSFRFMYEWNLCVCCANIYLHIFLKYTIKRKHNFFYTCIFSRLILLCCFWVEMKVKISQQNDYQELINILYWTYLCRKQRNEKKLCVFSRLPVLYLPQFLHLALHSFITHEKKNAIEKIYKTWPFLTRKKADWKKNIINWYLLIK